MIRIAVLLSIFGIALLFLGSSQDQRAGYQSAVQPACRSLTFDGSAFTLCTFDPARHQFELMVTDANNKPLRDFNRLRLALGPRARHLAFAMNAGMYDWNGLPIGLYVENGKERHALNRRSGKGNFHLQPNGVFWIDSNGPHVAETHSFAASKPDGLRWATQSGPMLVTKGQLHPKFSRDGSSRYIRNGVGLSKQGRLLFVISDDRISFGKFARLFHDRLGCDDALFLDGYVSSLWDGATGRNQQIVNIGPMIVVTEAP
jgi:uncharacterized protein YigE (DUF2233 family)